MHIHLISLINLDLIFFSNLREPTAFGGAMHWTTRFFNFCG